MDAAGVSVLVYPTWSNIPELIGDYGTITGRSFSLLQMVLDTDRLQQLDSSKSFLPVRCDTRKLSTCLCPERVS